MLKTNKLAWIKFGAIAVGSAVIFGQVAAFSSYLALQVFSFLPPLPDPWKG